MANNDNCSRCKQVFSRKDIRESICPYCSANPLNPAKARETSDKLLPSRDECLNAILGSTSRYRIVVAGPGTGKTYLFEKAIDPNSKKNLTLTFVNSLVEDLSLELGSLSDVFTLHSFARKALEEASRKKVKVFPKLTTIISEDAEIILDRKIDFEEIFNKRECPQADLDFYKARKDYYGRYYYGFSDMILAAVMFF
jgi:hypothetical protein